MISDTGKQIKEAGPSMPVEVIGISGSPAVGEVFLVMEEERIAREIAQRRMDRNRAKGLSADSSPRQSGMQAPCVPSASVPTDRRF